jgi:hypothetical protein
LELRVDRLETWAGPGQVEVLTTGFARLSAELAAVRKVQDRHTGQLTRLQADVAVLKTDVAELKTGMREILRRLPAGPPAD